MYHKRKQGTDSTVKCTFSVRIRIHRVSLPSLRAPYQAGQYLGTAGLYEEGINRRLEIRHKRRVKKTPIIASTSCKASTTSLSRCIR